MDGSAAAESSTLVVRLYQDASGGCRIQLEGAGQRQEYALVPFTLSIQLWMPAETPLLRAMLQLHGGPHKAVLQSNRQLIDLLRAWLAAEVLRETEVDLD